MRALFKSTNLIGDGLNIAPAFRLWHKLNPEVEIEFMTLPDAMQDVYTRMGVPIAHLNTTGGQFLPDEEYVLKHVFDCGQAFTIGDQHKMHIAIAYAMALGVPLDPTEESSYKLWYEPFEEDHVKDLILVSPFSRSCSSNEGLPPNKMIPFPAWGPMLRHLRGIGPIGVLGGPNDRMEGSDISEDEYFTGLSLNKVALMMRDCRFVVTIDNGMAHLAATQNAPTVEFYPECLGFHWIAPVGNPNLHLAQMNPAEIHPPQLLWILKDLIAKFESAKDSK